MAVGHLVVRPGNRVRSALPVRDRLGLYDHQPADIARPGLAQRSPEGTVGVMQLGLVPAQTQCGDLLAQGEIFENQLVPRLAERSEQVDLYGEEEVLVLRDRSFLCLVMLGAVPSWFLIAWLTWVGLPTAEILEGPKESRRLPVIRASAPDAHGR